MGGLILASGAGLFLVLLLRLALLLGATPVGGMREEIFYLRADKFRPLLRLGLVVLVLEAVQLLLPLLDTLGVVRAEVALVLSGAVDLVQAVLLAAVGLGLLMAFLPYSRRSLAELEVVARRSIEVVARRVPRQGRPGARRGG